MLNKEKQLEILHDHCKETFSYIRDREKQRDHLFLVVIGLLGVVLFLVQYPSLLELIFGEMKAGPVSLNIKVAPFYVPLTVTWIFLFVFVLRYCQFCINIERQYDYLHGLEDQISNYFPDNNFYNRESKSYLKGYPLFSNLVWYFYIIVFPLIMISAIILTITFELGIRDIPIYHLILDILLAISIVLCFWTYKLFPFVKNKIKKHTDEK